MSRRARERQPLRRMYLDMPSDSSAELPPCIGADPLCPCQDGLACHYRDATDDKP